MIAKRYRVLNQTGNIRSYHRIERAACRAARIGEVVEHCNDNGTWERVGEKVYLSRERGTNIR